MADLWITTPLPLAGGAGGGHHGKMPQFRSRPTQRAQQLRNNATDAERKLWRHLSRRQPEGHLIIRFWNNDVLGNVEGLLQVILEALNDNPPLAPFRMREGKSREAAEGWA